MRYLLIIAVVLITGFLLLNNKSPELGIENGHFKAMKNSPNGVSTQCDDESKLVETWSFNGDLNSTVATVKSILLSYEHNTIETESENYLHVIFKSDIIGFKDDVEFYFDEENEVIHYRSESRLGYSDMGLNLERYKALKALYDNQ